MDKDYYLAHYDTLLLQMSEKIKRFPDFPTPGITFLDWLPIFRDYNNIWLIWDKLSEFVLNLNPTIILGVEARGFLLAPIVAEKFLKGITVCRRPNKLPGKLITSSQTTEYGSGELAIQKGSTTKERVVIVDDVFATYGTLETITDLVETDGGKVVGAVGLIDLLYCSRSYLPSYPTRSIYSLDSPTSKFRLNNEILD